MKPPWWPPRWARTVTIIERAGLGGSAVLTDVVPSKTLIATADLMTRVGEAGELGVKFDVDGGDFAPVMRADLKHINDRLLGLARKQSEDIRARTGAARACAS